MMTLSPEQESAMDLVFRWLDGKLISEEPWMFYLGGFAGTGKTTLTQEIINRLPQPPLCLAPTGKAASVLQKKLTNAMVTTIHSALYKPVMPSTAQLDALMLQLKANPGVRELVEALKEEKQRLSRQKLSFTDNQMKEIAPGDLVIVDESSMVTAKMAGDLRATGAKVLFVGDPGQLPPVQDSGFIANRKPNALLKTIHRQALDNPIVKLSMLIREGSNIPRTIELPQLVRRPKTGYAFSELAKADQILSGMNVVRRRINRAIRKIKGYEGTYPRTGEKLICLKNRFDKGGMANGVQCFAASNHAIMPDGDIQLDVLYEDRLLHNISIYHYPFEAHYNERAEEDPWMARKDLAEFDFGYAITVHKAQGSEWDKVVVVDDGLFRNNARDRKRWLYTAVTRAKEQLTWLTSE